LNIAGKGLNALSRKAVFGICRKRQVMLRINDVSLREMMNDVAFGNDAFPSETFRKKTFGFRFYWI
jgi:hypothetical protein